MERSRYLFLLIGLLLVLLVSACAQIGGGVAPSTKPLNPGSYQTLGQVEGEDCAYYLLGLIPLTGFNSTQEALRDALSKQPGATALVQVTSDTRGMSYIIVGERCTIVQGTAVREK